MFRLCATPLLLLFLACGLSLASWDQREDVHSKESAHFKVFYDGDIPWILDHAAICAEEGFLAAADLTGLEPPTEKILLLMYAEADGWEIKPQDSDVLYVRGFVLPYHEPPPGVTAGVTIVIDASGEEGPSPATLRHEAAHAFVVGYLKEKSPRLPWWLSEGIAQLAAGQDIAASEVLLRAVREGRLVPLSPHDRLQVTLGPEQVMTGYAQAASLTRYIIETHGDAALGDILRYLAAGEPLPDAFEAATGRSLAGFQQAWLADIRSAIAAKALRRNLAIAAVSAVVALEVLLFVRAKRKATRRQDDSESRTRGEGTE